MKTKKDTTEEPVTVRVTRLKNIGWGIRIYFNGHLCYSRIAKNRCDIQPIIQSDLRMIDKCGGKSPMASASRMRLSIKIEKRKEAEGK